MKMTSRDGFTLVELLVSIVLLVAIAVAMVGSSRVSAMSVRRATLELRAAQLISDEYERLKRVAYADLADGTAVGPSGTAAWTVTDSLSFRRVELVVQTHPLAGMVIADTLYLYRTR